MTEIDVDSIPVEQLSKKLSAMGAEDRTRAKARLREHKESMMEVIADEWLEKQKPANMARPMAVRIKTWHNGDAAFGAWELLGQKIPGWRSVRPDEIVVVDMANNDVRTSMAKNIIELTTEAPTRPLVYPSKFAAEVLDPVKRKFKKVPKAHVDQALQQVAPVLQEIRTQYVEAMTRRVEDPQIPPQAAQQLQQLQIQREVTSDQNPEFDTVVETDENGEPILGKTGTRRRQRVSK